MWAVIPIKNLNETKHRLKSVLNPQERRFFFVAMFEDVLTTLLAVPELEQVAVATVCPTAAKIAENYGASVLSTEKDEGQTAAVARAAEILEANARTPSEVSFSSSPKPKTETRFVVPSP